MRNGFLIKFRNTLLLSTFSILSAFIYLEHQVNYAWGTHLAKDFGGLESAYSLFLGEFALAAIAVFLCAGVGFFLSERYRLPGMGRFSELKKLLPYFFVVSLPLAFIAYFLHDRIFIEGARRGLPAMLPEDILWSVVFLIYSVLLKETVLRFGLVTLGSGFFRGRHPLRAVGVAAVFSAGLGLRELGFAGMTPAYDLTTIGAFTWALLFNLCLGFVFVRKGLWASMSLRVFVESRTIVYAIIGIT